MAAATEGFTIRGYAAKMRSVDLKACWPFDGDAPPSLPPISIPNHRWWAEELEAVRSVSDLEITQPHDELIASTREDEATKGKQRGPKKRSIVELFAVAPHVDSVEEETDDDEFEETEQGGLVIGAGEEISPRESGKISERKQGGKRKEILRKRFFIKDSKNIKNGKKKRPRFFIKDSKNIKNGKKKRPKLEMCAAKKEKIHKPKVPCAVHISHLLQGSVRNRFGKTYKGPVDAQNKKPPKMKSSSKKHSSGFSQNSKLLAKNKEAAKVFPARSILKNQTRANSTKKTVFEESAQGDNLMKPRSEPEKHVTFSGKDDILEYIRSCSSKMLSNELALSSTMKDSCSGEKLPVTEKDEVLKEGANAAATDMNCSDSEKTSLSGTLDLNCAIQSFANLNCSSPGGSRVLNSTFIEGLNSNSGVQEEESNAGFEAEELYLKTTKGRNLPVSTVVSIEAKTDSLGQSREYLSRYNLSPRNTPTSICSLVGSLKHVEIAPAPDSFPNCRDKHIPDGFMGLPLNSQGELINSNSTGKSSLSDLFKKQNLLLGSESSFPVLNFADPNNRTDRTKMKESWFQDPASTERRDFGRIEIANLEPERNTGPSFQQDPKPLRAFHGSREYAQSREWTQPAIPTTMRLMGKDVTIGRRSKACEGIDNGEIWTDKEIIAEQSPHEPSPVPWPQREQPLKAPPSLYHMPSSDLQFDHVRLDSRPQWMSSSSLFSTIGNHGSNLSRPCHPVPLQAFLNSTQCKHRQRLSYSTPSTSPYLPQWLLNAKQEKNQKASFPSNTDPITVCHPCTIHGTNLLSLPSPYPTSLVPPPPLYHNSPSQKYGMATHSSLIHPSFIPSGKYTPELNPANIDKIKSRDGRESNFNYFKLLDRSRKRPAGGAHDLVRQVKRPNLTMYGNSNASNGPRQIERVSCSTRYPEAPAYGNNVVTHVIARRDNEQYGLQTAPRSSDFKLGGGSIAGPVKLSAGAKHILKPNHSLGQDNSKPIHSTIPLAVGDRTGMDLVSQKKAAEIYRF